MQMIAGAVLVVASSIFVIGAILSQDPRMRLPLGIIAFAVGAFGIFLLVNGFAKDNQSQK